MTDRESKDRSSGSSEPPEYQRFEDLTRRLLKVPKTEIDQKRRATTKDASSRRRTGRSA